MDLKHPNEAHKLTSEQWENIQFEGKEYCTLVNGCQLQLKATPFSEERTLSSIGYDNYTEIIQALEEKFTELKQKLNELDLEWAQADDKLRLEPQIARLRDYMNHASALGNYVPLFESLSEKERFIKDTYAENYQLKLDIVRKAETLAGEEDWKAATEEWPRLMEEWKNGPLVERQKNDALWERLEKARNTFHERRHEHQESINKERMQNLDLKMEVCEEADKLAQSENWRATTEAFKTLLEKWKNIGPVPSVEKNEELWKRFNDARNTFFERKKLNYEKISQEQEENYAQKLALVERAERLQEETTWKETAQAFADLMTAWKHIGKVPYEKADELWNRLQAARDYFFEAKRANAQAYKASLEENYLTKQELLQKAEALKNSTDWRDTTQQMNEMMYEWKKSGPVPREYGDTLWDQFLAARKYFFDRKDADRERRKNHFQRQINNRLHQTVQFLDKIRKELAEDEEKLADFQKSLEETTGDSAKDGELREHLARLIRQIESKLPERRKKIEDVERQKEELTQKCREVNGKDKSGGAGRPPASPQ